MSRIRDLVTEALALPEADRADLALRLVESLDGAPEPGVEDAWAREVADRVADVREDRVKTRTLRDAVADIRTGLRRA